MSNTFFLAGEFYHIYNRAVGNELLFPKRDNYIFFLKRTREYLDDCLYFYAFCLLPNHFHFLVKVKDVNGDQANSQLRKLFISYSMAVNKSYNRKGSLFMRPFKKKHVSSEGHLMALIFYLHLNPVHHNITYDFQNYEWSSYKFIEKNLNCPIKIESDDVIKLFGNKKAFASSHSVNKGRYQIQNLKLE